MTNPLIVINTLIAAIIESLEHKLSIQIQAAKDAHLAATHSESIAETKYDTFGLESSYLAQGQQKRVQEISAELRYFLAIDSSTDRQNEFIELHQLIHLTPLSEYLNIDEVFFFVANEAGGLKVTIDSTEVTVITPNSPIGGILLDKMLGDEVLISIKGKPITFTIHKIS